MDGEVVGELTVLYGYRNMSDSQSERGSCYGVLRHLSNRVTNRSQPQLRPFVSS